MYMGYPPSCPPDNNAERVAGVMKQLIIDESITPEVVLVGNILLENSRKRVCIRAESRRGWLDVTFVSLATSPSIEVTCHSNYYRKHALAIELPHTTVSSPLAIYTPTSILCPASVAQRQSVGLVWAFRSLKKPM